MILEFCDNGSLKGKPHYFNIEYLIRKSDKFLGDILLEFGLPLFWMLPHLDFLRGRSKRKTSSDKRRQHQEVDFDKLIMISENVASGMAELVRLGVVHRGLAARNVMIDQWLQVSTFYVFLSTYALYL